MLRICLIGDSHLAALKQGWPSIEAEFPDTEVAFFAAGGDMMLDLVVRGRRLQPSTEKLREILKFTSGRGARIQNTFDRYVLCGLRFSIEFAVKLRTENGNSIAPDDLYSVYDAAVGPETLRKLRRITDAPVVIVPTPFPAFGRRVELSQHRTPQSDRDLAETFLSTCERIARDHGAAFLPQAAETVCADGISTLDEFAVGAARLWPGADDNSHMNAKFGAIALRRALLAAHDHAGPLSRRIAVE